MKLTLQLVVVILNATTKFRDNLFKFTLYTIITYKVGDTRCHFRRHAPFQHNFFHKITLSSNFPPREGGFGQMMYRSPERSPQDSQGGFFWTVPRPHFLGRGLIWPGYFGEHVLSLFGLYPSNL